MTTEIEVTNHPETRVIIVDRRLTPAETTALASAYTEASGTDRYNIGHLASSLGGIKDNPTVTTVRAERIMRNGQTEDGTDDEGRALRLRDNQSLIILRKDLRDETHPFVTVRRVKG